MTRYTGIKGRAWNAVKARTRKKYKHCYTCNNKYLEGKNAQAGHYRPVAIVGMNNKMAWDERFIRLQCARCNGAGQGEQVIFRRKLVEEHGEALVAEYDRRVAGKFVNKVENWEDIIKEEQIAF